MGLIARMLLLSVLMALFGFPGAAVWLAGAAIVALPFVAILSLAGLTLPAPFR
jgi:hypothetical protein